ncbi:coproporphyrinogen III oxidase [Fistulina hepatica ATCC 64428]|uniref:coproporphyrinogen oxidase n=1 Tax=Fistulina hepatica ATCC 64428 TaxID=1128425 RepID=A0A0D7A504_9AGAR|nr:coproporphyrinogen III oxidase [Fistulina hepatica ATCC 64428]
MADTRPMRVRMEEFINGLQDEIVTALEGLDPNAPKFLRDRWSRPQGGYGCSCVFGLPDALDGLVNGKPTVFEKAGVNVSVVHGRLPPAAVQQMRADHTSMPLPKSPEGGLPFFAAGISLVIHPRNPHAPTSHANYRYFEIADPTSKDEHPPVLAWWFGGGSDLTPSYLYEEDAVHFHKVVKDACTPHGSLVYHHFKKWCDEYFYLPYRGEERGVGGIFFDDLNEGENIKLPVPKGQRGDKTLRPYDKEALFTFLKSVGHSFVPSYVPIVAKRHSTPYTPEERRWQLIRRGRYVEFNLIIDRGTKFGLMAPGPRVESILMSLPQEARWEYMTTMGGEGTVEGKLMAVLRKPREWVPLD